MLTYKIEKNNVKPKKNLFKFIKYVQFKIYYYVKENSVM